ncbi:MAG: site-specific integrase [Bacteroidota bacterium]
MAKYNFNLREATASTETPINFVIRWDNNRLVYPTNETVNPKYWQTDKKKSDFQRATNTKQFPAHSELNSRLTFIHSTAENLFRCFLNDNKRQPTVEELRELLNKELNGKQNTEKKLDFFGFIERFISDSKNRTNDSTGKPLNVVTIRIYKRSKDLLLEFSRGRKNKIDFDSINLDFYFDYTAFLTNEKKFSTNTIGKHIRTLKIFLNDATERGLNTSFAYKSKRFKIQNEKTESIYLTEKELEDIYKLDLSNNPRLDKVRDLFLVGCWTGLRFSDFSTITPENIKGDFIEIETQKTKQKVLIPIHNTVKQIMKKYKGKYPNSLPPSISNAKMNEYIKEFAKMDIKSLEVSTSKTFTKGGINITKSSEKHKLITTHTARRSFATNLYKDKVPAYTIMQITGHKTEKAFLSYIKVTNDEHAKILQLHWQQKQTLLKVV